MPVTFAGSGSCSTLIAESTISATTYSGVAWNTGTNTLTITPTVA